MYQKKHFRKANKTRYQRQRPRTRLLHLVRTASLCMFLVFLVVIGVNQTIAYMQQRASVTNRFDIAVVEAQIEESFQNNIKEDVFVMNNSDFPVYVRAALVFQWKDSDGYVLGGTPEENIDYDLELLLTEEGWFKGDDGYYYYRKPVKSGEPTSILVQSCTPKNPESQLNKISLDVMVQVIQATPSEAIEEAWGIHLKDDGTMIESEGEI